VRLPRDARYRAEVSKRMNSTVLRSLIRAWLLTALVDFLYASTSSVFGYHGTFSRLWQGVASVLLGPSALQGGTRTVLIGLLMHLCVALAWSAVFLLLVLASPWLRRVVATPGGIVGVAAVYGPVIWIVMSLVVIRTLTGRPPMITARWWVTLIAHIPFVAIPIVWMIGRGMNSSERLDARSLESLA
jgi:hypothetical protein